MARQWQTPRGSFVNSPESGKDWQIPKTGFINELNANTSGIFKDNFNRPTENLEDDPNWTRTGGVVGSAKVNASEQLRGTNGTDALYLCPDQGSADCYTEVNVISTNNNTKVACLRSTDDQNYIGVRVQSGVMQLFKRVAGTYTNIGGVGSIFFGTGGRVRIQAEGDTITCWVNRVKDTGIGDVTETFNNTVTRQGFVIRSLVDPLFDNFEAGTLAALQPSQWLIPGVGIINAPATENEWLIPGSGIFNEISVSGAIATTITLTGSATVSITEADIVTGGKKVVLTLTDDTFVTGAASEDGIAAGSNSDIAASGTNWNSLIKNDLDNTNVVISTTTVANDTATITLPAYLSYDNAVQETITWTIPAASLTNSAIDVVATPTFTIDPVVSGTLLISQARNKSRFIHSRIFGRVN